MDSPKELDKDLASISGLLFTTRAHKAYLVRCDGKELFILLAYVFSTTPGRQDWGYTGTFDTFNDLIQSIDRLG